MRTIFVLAILAVVWGVALIPPLLRARADHRPTESVHNFRRQLSDLSRIPPPMAGPRPGAPVRAFRAAPPQSGGVRTAPVSTRASLATRPAAAHGYQTAAARIDARRRRQNVLLTLVALSAVAGIAWLGIGVEAARIAFFVLAALLVVYVYMLVLVRRNEEARAPMARGMARGRSAQYHEYWDAA